MASIASEKGKWSPILNKGDKLINKKERKEERARYTSTFILLIGHLKEKDID